MARDGKRHACGAPQGGAKAPQGKRSAKAARSPSHPLPEERALFLHLIRALAREAARADHVVDSRSDDTAD